MKKTLLAAALLAGFAGAASAQSSVTLYGILDGGLRYQSLSLANGDGVNNFGAAYGVQNGIYYGRVPLIVAVAFYTLAERKVIGWMHVRHGPQFVGRILGIGLYLWLWRWRLQGLWGLVQGWPVWR